MSLVTVSLYFLSWHRDTLCAGFTHRRPPAYGWDGSLRWAAVRSANKISDLRYLLDSSRILSLIPAYSPTPIGLSTLSSSSSNSAPFGYGFPFPHLVLSLITPLLGLHLPNRNFSRPGPPTSRLRSRCPRAPGLLHRVLLFQWAQIYPSESTEPCRSGVGGALEESAWEEADDGACRRE